MTPLFAVPDAIDTDDDMGIPAPAAEWSESSVDLWLSTHAEAAEDGEELDARATALLAHACDALTVEARLRDAVEELPELTTTGSTGQLVSHPLLGSLRAAQAATLAAIKALAVPAAQTAQTAAASNARWAR